MRNRKPLTTLAHATARSFALKSAPLFLAACVAAALSFSARAQGFRVTDVELRADTPELSGPCPLKVTFKGAIKASGPGKVQYTFTRSDGATSPTYVLEFTEAGSQTVTTDWTLGDVRALSRYEGWQAIRILYPNNIESSRKAGKFEIKCLADVRTETKIVTTPEPQPSTQASNDSQPKRETPVWQIEIVPGSDKSPKVPPHVDLGTEPSRIVTSLPSARTIWEFMREYSGADRATRLQKSFAVGNLLAGCSGAMISPHIFMTAAHCGGPGWTGFVRFIRIDEDSANPGPTSQAYSEMYYARTFPWQTLGTDTAGAGDTILWWLDNGSDGVPPGIKYGYLELNPNAVRNGDQAYSFWVNPVDTFNGLPLDWTIIYSSGSATQRYDGGWRGPSTDFNMYGTGGASGSAVSSASGYDVIGVTSAAPLAGGTPRTTADTDYFLRRFDSDRNSVLDPVEHDWLMTQPLQNFYLFQFNTPLRRAQWMKNPITEGSFTTETGGWTGKVTSGSDGDADGLWHRTAKFTPNATYRISAAVMGSGNQMSYVRFWSDSAGGGAQVMWRFHAGTNLSRVAGRVTLGNFPDYRLIIGTGPNSTLHVQDLAIVREDATTLNFETGEERRSWEYVGSSYVTSWGIGGSNDFSGVVVGPCTLCLLNRYVGFRQNAQYTVTFTARHVSGATSGTPFVRIQNLDGVEVFNHNWQFNSAGEQLSITVTFRNGSARGQTLTFGTDSDLRFMVDDIRIQEVPWVEEAPTVQRP